MKVTLFLSVFLVTISSTFAQETSTGMFSSFQTGLYGGVNFLSLDGTGASFVVEAKTNLTSNLKAKISVGYTKSIFLDSYPVKTYWFNGLKYETISYNAEKEEYKILPLTLGFDYVINYNLFSPYLSVELGYNSYTTTKHTTIWISGEGGSYDTEDQIPEEFRNEPKGTSDKSSYRLGLGIGTDYKLSPSVNLDVRYLYQFNKIIINTNQILIGFNFLI